MKKNNLESFLQSVLEKIKNNSLIKNDNFSGKEILEFTEIYQVNLFILKKIFEEWEQNIEKNKSSYFNYDSEQVVSISREYSNILSKNISINIDQVNSVLNFGIIVLNHNQKSLKFLWSQADSNR